MGVYEWKELYQNKYETFLPPFDPKDAMTSVKMVRNSGVQAEKYDTSTVLSSLLVSRTKNTKRGTTRKLYPRMLRK